MAAPVAWMEAVQLLCWAPVLQLQASQYWAGMPGRYQQPPRAEVKRRQGETAPPAAAAGHAVAETAPLLSASIAWPPVQQVGLQERSWSDRTGKYKDVSLHRHSSLPKRSCSTEMHVVHWTLSM